MRCLFRSQPTAKTARRRRSGRGSLLLWLALRCLLAVWLSELAWSQTLSPQKVWGRYQQLSWREEHGLPQNAVEALLRTRDGYLWLGTQAGAARFDGVRFTVFNKSNSPVLPRNRFYNLLEDRQGDLWATLKTAK